MFFPRPGRTVSIVFPLPGTLVKTLAKNLAKFLVKDLTKNVVLKWCLMFCSCSFPLCLPQKPSPNTKKYLRNIHTHTHTKYPPEHLKKTPYSETVKYRTEGELKTSTGVVLVVLVVGFRGPGGWFRGNRSGGKPRPRLRLKNHTQDSTQKPRPGPQGPPRYSFSPPPGTIIGRLVHLQFRDFPEELRGGFLNVFYLFSTQFGPICWTKFERKSPSKSLQKHLKTI